MSVLTARIKAGPEGATNTNEALTETPNLSRRTAMAEDTRNTQLKPKIKAIIEDAQRTPEEQADLILALSGISEEWRPVTGYETLYEVSNMGRVRRIADYGYRKGPRYLSTATKTGDGRPIVELSQNGQKEVLRVAHLVLDAFIGPRPEGHVSRHLNDVPFDNRLANLEWGTESENMHDRVRNGGNPSTEKTHCKYGHEFTEDNIYRMKSGGRRCKKCQNKWNEESKARRNSRALT